MPFAAPNPSVPAAPPVPSTALERWEHGLDKLAALPSELRQAVADAQWRSIPVPFREAMANPAQAVGVALQLRPSIAGLVKVTQVVACVPDLCTGTITLGDVTLYVPAGITVIPGMSVILGAVDTRALSTATTSGVTSGPTALLVTGEQLPTAGYLAP